MQLKQDIIIQTVFIVPPKVPLLDMTGPATIFHEAYRYGAPVRVLFSSIFPCETTADSSCMLSFYNLTPFDQLMLNAGDVVFVPGFDLSLLSDTAFKNSSAPFRLWLNAQHKKGVIICSVCTGAFLLAETGLLTGRACTTHWNYTDLFKRNYPQAKLLTNRLFVHQDGIYTSAGMSSGIDLSLYLIEHFWGPHFATLIAKEVVIYFRRALDDPQLNIFTQYRNHLEHRIHVVQSLLSQSLQQKFTIEQLADKVYMSKRNLTRLFKQTTQITIGAYINQLRAEYAKKLLEEGHSLQTAAVHCGLKSAKNLKNLIGRGKRA